MASKVLHVRVDEKIKEEADEIFHNLGMDMSTAVRLFLDRTVLIQGMPFSIQFNIDNQIEEPSEFSAQQKTTTFNPSLYLQSIAEKDDL